MEKSLKKKIIIIIRKKRIKKTKRKTEKKNGIKKQHGEKIQKTLKSSLCKINLFNLT